MKTVILCGGLGTRAYPYTARLPKALMPVAGLPIVEQVMRIYASQGHERFVLATGHLGDDIARYFEQRSGWDVEIVDTGADTLTADRARACLDRVGDTFFLTYCDGLGDIDLAALEAARGAGDGITLTATPLRSQYGVLDLDGDLVSGFREKPVLDGHWINAGFFCLDRTALAEHAGADLERHVLPSAAAARALFVHRHHGFWRSMDTFKDQQQLDESWGPHSRRLDEALGADRQARTAELPGWLLDRYEAASPPPT